MTFTVRSLKLLGIVTIALFCFSMMPIESVDAQIPSITVTIGDTTAAPGSINTPITIFMDNLWDDVAGFNIWIQLDRPDIMEFQTDTMTVIDTTFWECLNFSGPNCTDSVEVFGFDSTWHFFYIDTVVETVGSFDTTGCLTSGWEFVDTRSISGTGLDLNIVGIADLPGGLTVPAIPQGQQGGVLLRVLADVFNIDDSLTDRTVNMLIQTDFKDHFSFSRPDGSSITWIPTEVEDTICWVCTSWLIDPPDTICTNYQSTLLFEDCDSTSIEIDTVGLLDTANVVINNGSVTVLYSFVCGNIDNSAGGFIDIGDLVYLVNFMFANPAGPAPDPYESGDVNCSGFIDISDLVYMVDFMFGNPTGPEPCAVCP